MFETQNTTGQTFASGITPRRPVSDLFLQGFGQEQIARLVKARSRFIDGDLTEWTAENSKQLLFARWLVEHGKLREA